MVKRSFWTLICWALIVSPALISAQIVQLPAGTIDRELENVQVEFTNKQDLIAPQNAPTGQDTLAYSDLFRPMRVIEVDIRESHVRRPDNRAGDLGERIPRDWVAFDPVPLTLMWESPDIVYQPLFFEDVALERYGQTTAYPRQVVKSAVNFGVSFFSLPVHVFVDNPQNCDTPLGFCRPGSATPRIRQQLLYRQ